MSKRYSLIGSVVLLLSLGFFGQALAHAKLVTSTPAAGAKLTKAPATVTINFSEEISEKDSNFTVADAKGATVGTGKLDLNDLDHKTLTATLKTGLGDGIYTVAWKTVTPDDGGISEGKFTFGVNAEPGAQPTAAAEPTTVATAAPTATAKAGTVTATATAAPTAATAGGTSTTTAPQTLPATGDSGTPLFVLLLLGITILGGGLLLRKRHGAE